VNRRKDVSRAPNGRRRRTRPSRLRRDESHSREGMWLERPIRTSPKEARLRVVRPHAPRFTFALGKGSADTSVRSDGIAANHGRGADVLRRRSFDEIRSENRGASLRRSRDIRSGTGRRRRPHRRRLRLTSLPRAPIFQTHSFPSARDVEARGRPRSRASAGLDRAFRSRCRRTRAPASTVFSMQHVVRRAKEDRPRSCAPRGSCSRKKTTKKCFRGASSAPLHGPRISFSGRSPFQRGHRPRTAAPRIRIIRARPQAPARCAKDRWASSVGARQQPRLARRQGTSARGTSAPRPEKEAWPR